MKGADIVVGWVESSGTAYLQVKRILFVRSFDLVEFISLL